MTDEPRYLSRPLAGSSTITKFVRHGAGEYVSRRRSTRTRSKATFRIFKRGMKGIYQHCGKQHLHRYVAEFEFRYNHRIAQGLDR